MIDIDNLFETSADIKHATEKAKSHYFDVKDDNEALLHLLIRSVKHAEQDDRRQFAEITELKNRLTELENIIAQINR